MRSGPPVCKLALGAVICLGGLACGGQTRQASDGDGTSAVSATGPQTTLVATRTSSIATSNTTIGSVATNDSSTAATNAVGVADGAVLRVEMAGGCPTSVLHVAHWGGTSPEFVTNPDNTGLADVFVPGASTAALICRYRLVHYDASSQPASGGDLFSSTTLDQNAADVLAREANSIVPSTVGSACLFGDSDHARYTAVVFAVPGRSDVDLWLNEWVGCPGLSNGDRDSGLLINGLGSSFLEQLNTDAVPPSD